jgi:hypothetical protein
MPCVDSIDESNPSDQNPSDGFLFFNICILFWRAEQAKIRDERIFIFKLFVFIRQQMQGEECL